MAVRPVDRDALKKIDSVRRQCHGLFLGIRIRVLGANPALVYEVLRYDSFCRDEC